MMERIHKVNTIQRCDGARVTYLCAETDTETYNCFILKINYICVWRLVEGGVCVVSLQMELG